MPTLSLAAPLAAAPCADGEQVCDLVYDWTGNARFADWADVLIGTPLAIIGLILFGFVVRWVLHQIVERIARRAEKGVLPERLDAAAIARRAQRAETMAGIFQSVITVIVIAVVTTMILSEVGVNIAPIIASAGIIGIALGFGAQSLVKDFLSGIFIFIEDQYGVGDVVDLGEAIGSVEAVTLRMTRLRDVNGTVWFVPNGEILRVGNQSKNWSRAVVDVGVGYSEDLARVQQVLREIAHDMWERRGLQGRDHRGARGDGRRDAGRRLGDHPGPGQDRAAAAVGGRPDAPPADQGPLRPRGHRDPVRPARRLAPRRPLRGRRQPRRAAPMPGRSTDAG